MSAVRRERLGGLVALPAGAGLEIGPLADPILLTADHDVRYVDVVDQAGLREHYRDDASVDCDAIPAIDFTLTNEKGVVTLAEAVRDGAPFSYVVACHVIEHVPDVIGWLGDIAHILVESGLLVLVVPDKRHCFDYYRQLTSVGQMLQAAEAHDLTPSVRAVYDHFRDAVSVSVIDTWDGIPAACLEDIRLYDLDGTLAQVERARSGHYVDSHVWTFTPDTFVEQICDLGVLGRCDFEIEALLPTPEDALEFYAVLRRLPRQLDEPATRVRVERARDRARAAVRAAPCPLDPVALAHAAEVEALQAQLREREAAIGRLRHELAEIKQSERWKLGGALVAPAHTLLRALGRRLRGRGAPARDS